MAKIYVSPSDQVKNAYAAGNTTEAIQCRRIAKALVTALERCGLQAKTNVTSSMADRVAESNAWGADLHVCLHTNAFNAQVSGTRIFSFNLTGEGYKAAKAVFARLAPLTPGTSENIKAYPELYEVRKSSAPCVYIEVDFHDVDVVALWLVEHTEEIAEAICHGICEYCGVAYVSPGTTPAPASDRYQSIDDVPAWARAETQELIDLGALKGNDKDPDVTDDLNITDDMLRTMIVNLRATKALLHK